MVADRPHEADPVSAFSGSSHARVQERWLEQAAKKEAARTGDSEDSVVACYRQRLHQGEPLQYVLGTWQFRWLDLQVDRRALIPRPETELLVDLVVSEIADAGSARVLEFGTGTGAIAASLASEVPSLYVVATDSSQDALALAAENIDQLGLDQRVELRRGHWWEAVEPHERFAIICSNPPYVSDDEWLELETGVRDWEPREALVAGPSGLECYQVIFERAVRHLDGERGAVIVEIGAEQGPDVVDIARSASFGAAIIRQDLTGRDRFVVARR
ncbi:peptide chain release factor N(5)-glutamine methyltransferase [Ferrimicrobium sp.]|uniref:peptide chain release factor N(5)-glutamine methyltransferase n=1 Tax=Ferrimicrobium sp. TaxID=2926050 RepID=UPI00261B97CC|nr:peptide chain release factor N(5)-glutamine methyltransferase [Ferrimicrobium sp.]